MLTTYIAKKGDAIWALAEKFRVDLRTLVNLNPHIRDPDDIPAGTKVNLPSAAYPGMPAHPGDPYAVHPFGMSPVPAYPVASPYSYPNQPLPPNVPVSPYPAAPHAPLANAPVPKSQDIKPLEGDKKPKK